MIYYYPYLTVVYSLLLINYFFILSFYLSFYLFRICRKGEISFDIVAKTGNIVAQNGNNVEATLFRCTGSKSKNIRAPFV